MSFELSACIWVSQTAKIGRSEEKNQTQSAGLELPNLSEDEGSRAIKSVYVNEKLNILESRLNHYMSHDQTSLVM